MHLIKASFYEHLTFLIKKFFQPIGLFRTQKYTIYSVYFLKTIKKNTKYSVKLLKQSGKFTIFFATPYRYIFQFALQTYL